MLATTLFIFGFVDTLGRKPSLFISAVGMGSLFYLIIATIKEGFGVPIGTIALDALNVLFWFCAAVATAAYLGARSCSNQVCIDLPYIPISPLSP